MTVNTRISKLEKEQNSKGGELRLYQVISSESVLLYELGSNGIQERELPELLPNLKTYEEINPKDWD